MWKSNRIYMCCYAIFYMFHEVWSNKNWIYIKKNEELIYNLALVLGNCQTDFNQISQKQYSKVIENRQNQIFDVRQESKHHQ